MTKTLALIGGLVAALAMGRAMAATPFGGDDDGAFVPPDKDTAKCEDSVGKSVGKAAACIFGCHKKYADGKLDATGEDNCEHNLPAAADCQGKYNAVTGNSSKINALCPSCLNAAARAGLFTTVETIIDANNNKVYCAGTTAWDTPDADTGFIPPDKDTAKCED